MLEKQKIYYHTLFKILCTAHTVREVLSLNVIIHLGSIRKQAATSHAGHCSFLCVSTKMFFQSMFAAHYCTTTCQVVKQLYYYAQRSQQNKN